MSHEARIESLGVKLPAAPKPGGTYVPAVQVGNLLYIAGMVPLLDGKPTHLGTLGADVSIEEAHAAARQCVLNALAVIRGAVGSLDRIERFVYVQGFVQAAAGFTDSHVVMNGASDYLVELFGDCGRHARAAVGVSALPLGVPVEIQFVVQLTAENVS
jgi:enamine deaminase RidA (YjgF/YER057c/UK114 family)